MENKNFLIGLFGAILGITYTMYILISILIYSPFLNSIWEILLWISIIATFLTSIGLIGVVTKFKQLKSRRLYLIPPAIYVSNKVFTILAIFSLNSLLSGAVLDFVREMFTIRLLFLSFSNIFLGLLLLGTVIQVRRKFLPAVLLIIGGQVQVWTAFINHITLQCITIPSCNVNDLVPYWSTWVHIGYMFDILIWVGFFLLFYKLFKSSVNIEGS